MRRQVEGSARRLQLGMGRTLRLPCPIRSNCTGYDRRVSVSVRHTCISSCVVLFYEVTSLDADATMAGFARIRFSAALADDHALTARFREI